MMGLLSTGITAGSISAAGIGLLAGGYAYASRWPGSRIFGDTLIALRKPQELALTFDDGPNPAWTPQLLDILAAHEVRATFFLLGCYAEAEPELVRRIVDSGHLIGNHSWSHPNLALCGTERIQDELSRTSDALEQIAGLRVKFFRPPFGARRPAALRIARELGMVPVMWNAMTNDWEEPRAERIAERLIEKIELAGRNGSAANIVMHDGGHREPGANRGPSVTAAGLLCARLRTTHRFVTVDAWG